MHSRTMHERLKAQEIQGEHVGRLNCLPQPLASRIEREIILYTKVPSQDHDLRTLKITWSPMISQHLQLWRLFVPRASFSKDVLKPEGFGGLEFGANGEVGEALSGS